MLLQLAHQIKASQVYTMDFTTDVMDNIHYSRIRVIYVSHPCALGLALRNVCNIFMVLTITTLLKLRWI